MIPVSVYNAIFLANRVKFGSLEHVVPILLAVVFGIVFINFAKQSLDKQKQKRVLHVFACCISGIVLSFHLYKISLGHYNIKTDLPLYLCSLLALLVYRIYLLQKVLDVRNIIILDYCGNNARGFNTRYSRRFSEF